MAEALIYRIDANDCICHVNDAWEDSVRAHDATGLRAEAVLGRRLWDFFTAGEVRELYARLIARVRRGQTVVFDYRCDTADKERTFELAIRACPGGEVEFVTTLRREIGRRPVALLARRSRPGGPDEVAMCDMCQRIELPVNFWVPIEQGVELSGLLQGEVLPRLRHTLCPDCRVQIGRKLN